MSNLIENPGFENEWDGNHRVLSFNANGALLVDRNAGEIFVPDGWLAAFYIDGQNKPPAHDPNNPVGWSQPEIRDSRAKDPDRMHSGEKGLLCFTFARIHDAGIMQKVLVQPGKTYKLTAFAHAWSNAYNTDHTDNPKWSEGPGFNAGYALEGDDGLNDDWRNFAFCVGVSLSGGTNPYADDVIWSQGAHVYNGFHELPELKFTVPSECVQVTVFLRSRCLWAFKHNDAYWDDVLMELVDDDEVVPVPEGTPVVAKGSKIGVHGIYADGIPDMVDGIYVNGASIPVVKAVDDLSWLKQVKNLDDNVITLARLTSGYEGCVECNNSDADLDELAHNLFEPIDAKLQSDPDLKDAVNYWEICNEPLGGGATVNSYVRLANLMIRCMDLADERGIKLGLFAFNAGTPEWADMVAMTATDVFRRASQDRHIITLHEGVLNADDPIDLYWNVHNVDENGEPTTEDTGLTEVGGWLPPKIEGDLVLSDSPVLDDAGAMCFRYRFLKLAVQNTGVTLPPVVVSEWYGGIAPSKVNENAQRFVWYDSVAIEDPELLAFCPFTWGPTGQWVNQDYKPMSDWVVDYAILMKNRQNAEYEEQQPPIQPPETNGSPRVDYARKYVVLDPNLLSIAQMQEVVSSYWNKGQFVTFGPSYDDAMTHYGLTDVTAVLYNIREGNQANYTDFRDAYYPNAKIEFRTINGNGTVYGQRPVYGLHDAAGGEYLLSQGVKGCVLIPHIVRETAARLDYSHLKNAGQFVIVRLNWGWAQPSGDGTIAPPNKLNAHLSAIVETVRNAVGVDLFQLWNEPNNASEHPSEYMLTPEYVFDAYNTVWEAVEHAALLSPPPVDPYYGPNSDNRIWNTKMLNGISGADYLVTHAGKTQINAPDSIWSDVMFSDDPLTWQYLNAKTLYTWMDQVPANLRGVPVICGELNPQYLTAIGGKLGWAQGNSEWIAVMDEFLREWNGRGEQQVSHAVFYRWGYDSWALENKSDILATIVGLLK